VTKELYVTQGMNKREVEKAMLSKYNFMARYADDPTAVYVITRQTNSCPAPTSFAITSGGGACLDAGADA